MDEREGGDITAADMVLPETDPSQITAFYKDTTILLTGATGFLGKIFLEKLLRTCNDLRMVYVLVRPKKGKDVQERFDELFEGPSFDPLKRKHPNFREKVTLVAGDCGKVDLGLSEKDRQRLIEECSVVIHCAATVRFDQTIKNAAYINVRSVADLITMAKMMKKLKSFIYVSTAFSYCTRLRIDEVIYKPPMTASQLLTLVNIFDDDQLNKMTPILLGDYPNTYIFTKAIAEDLIKREAGNLPVGIFRPGIVIASVKEPVAGWIDNYYGATGVLVGAALGVLRSLHGKKEQLAEIVPADYVVNCGLATAWEVATIRSINDNKEEREESTRDAKLEKDIPVYNFVSSPEKSISWYDFTRLSEEHATKVPTDQIIWAYFFKIRSSLFMHNLAVFLYHTIPAYIVDFLCICIRKEPRMVEGYKKINKFAEVISQFTTTEWIFTNNNVETLWQKMNKHDKELFEFNMKKFNWDLYFHTYVRGIRVYLLKDPLETINKGKRKYYLMKACHYSLIAVICIIFLIGMIYLYSFIF